MGRRIIEVITPGGGFKNYFASLANC